jgi:hypothetical protein
MRQLKLTTIAIALLLPTTCAADGQGWLGVVSDIWKFIGAFALWILMAKFAIKIYTQYKKKTITNKQKYFIWIGIVCIAFFHWSMIKFDPYPTEGPIDSIIWKEKVEKKKMADSIEAVQYLEKKEKQSDSIINKVLNSVQELKIVKDKIVLVDSLSNHTRNISLIPTLDDTLKNIYLVTVGENNETNRVTYFHGGCKHDDGA